MNTTWKQTLLKTLGTIAMTVAAIAPLVTTWLFIQEEKCPDHLCR